jgi:hypothetical protein
MPAMPEEDEDWLLIEAIRMANLGDIFAKSGALQRKNMKHLRKALLQEVGRMLQREDLAERGGIDMGPERAASGQRPQVASLDNKPMFQNMLSQQGMVSGFEAFSQAAKGRAASQSISGAQPPNNAVLQAAAAAMSQAATQHARSDNTLRSALNAIPAPRDSCASMVYSQNGDAAADQQASNDALASGAVADLLASLAHGATTPEPPLGSGGGFISSAQADSKPTGPQGSPEQYIQMMIAMQAMQSQSSPAGLGKGQSHLSSSSSVPLPQASSQGRGKGDSAPVACALAPEAAELKEFGCKGERRWRGVEEPAPQFAARNVELNDLTQNIVEIAQDSDYHVLHLSL